MSYLTAGINHKTAPVSLREQLVFPPAELPQALKSARDFLETREVAILSTCNRTEMYCTRHMDHRRVLQWLSDYHHIQYTRLPEHTYFYCEQEAVRHIMRVASGLDSMILGEPQILGQLKTAYTIAQDAGTTGSLLSRLFQSSFTTAKQVRTETAIGQQPVSIAYAATRLAQRIFADLSDNTVLLIGAGETIELVARHFYKQGIQRIIVANRSLSHAKRLAAQFNGSAIPLSALPDTVQHADIIVSSTASPVPILGKGAVEKALKARRHRPIFMIDIAVPRDIEPEVAELPDVFLYTVDDLHNVIENNLKKRQEAANQAENVVEQSSREFMNQLQSLSAVSILRQYRDNIEVIRDGEVKKAMHYLGKGASPEQALTMLARSITNKIMHTPSIQLKKAAGEGHQDQLQWATELLGIDDEPNPPSSASNHPEHCSETL
ncbi:Glutamyl-tRNA reductase [invertebrate metagenome]|uniref:glutamyl-tRNA reductase n=1 Tax=invertebrate metagenome TaxID=1711999 RepID=A0A2H9T942_9ZZZZ